MEGKEFLESLRKAGFIAEDGGFDEAYKAIRRVCRIASDMSFDAGYTSVCQEFDDMATKLASLASITEGRV